MNTFFDVSIVDVYFLWGHPEICVETVRIIKRQADGDEKGGQKY